jgi:hypothetical protein
MYQFYRFGQCLGIKHFDRKSVEPQAESTESAATTDHVNGKAATLAAVR